MERNMRQPLLSSEDRVTWLMAHASFPAPHNNFVHDPGYGILFSLQFPFL